MRSPRAFFLTSPVRTLPLWPLWMLLAFSGDVSGQEVSFGTGEWDMERYGNHRAVVEVSSGTNAVWAHIPWRRRDENPEAKNILVMDEATGERITNVVRLKIDRESADLVFQPITVPGKVYVYYMPYETSGRSNYPTVVYASPEETADKAWLSDRRLEREEWKQLPQAKVVEFQSIDEFNSFWPMEVIATETEMKALRELYPEAPYLVFPEDRRYPIRMTDDLPFRWIESGARKTFHGEALRGEFFAFQLGIYAVRQAIENLDVGFSTFVHQNGADEIPSARARCIHLGGVDWTGKPFTKSVSVEQGKIQAIWCGLDVQEDTQPGHYLAKATVTADNLESTIIDLDIEIESDLIEAHGDNEPWRHSRLRWLDSTLALDDELVSPYTAVEWDNTTLSVLGRRVKLADSGFPGTIVSHLAPEMTHITDEGRELLSAPMELAVEVAERRLLRWQSEGPRVVRRAPGIVVWESESSSAEAMKMSVRGAMELDGNMEYVVVLTADEPTTVEDIRLLIPIENNVAKYMMGMGHKGGFRPEEFHWQWEVTNNQDGAWIGDVNAGLQFSMKDENYSRPLNTNFYQSKPLVMPSSWSNEGKGGCRMKEVEEGGTFLVTCFSGPRTIRPGEKLYYNFRLLLTPFRPLDTKKQWATRFFHRFEPLDEIAKTGANTVNVHHATEINPWINYPFLRPEEMKAYVDEAHSKNMKVKIYYTVRELSNKAPELFALKSLGDEIFSHGPGGGFSWLQEHLDGDYIAGWLVPRILDAAVVNSGVSRWHNYYLEGLAWVVDNVRIDGLYIDDVAFDRTVMKRLRKILDRGREGALIDLHSANQYNERDGFANSANLYLEHFPYLDRLWFGEYFDYDSSPDFWLIELSGIPFGLMGEMLQDGGNPWRGMLYGMTTRLPWAGDPSALWRFWDEFGIQDTRMIGYWVPSAPVKTNHPDVLATTYVGDGKALVSVASWAREPVDVRLEFDWRALGIESSSARITASAIKDFQEQAEFSVDAKIRVEPGRGWLLVIK